MSRVLPKSVAFEAVSANPSHLYPKTPVFTRANGCWLFDTTGQRFFDGTGGSGAISLGHQHPQVLAAMVNQAQKLIHTGWNLQSDVRLELIKKLGCFSPYDPCAVLFTVTGAEAIEAALKIARAYTGRQSVIAFERSYHGKTAGALSITWREQFKRYSVLPRDTIFFSQYPILHSHATNAHTDACLHVLRKTIKQAFNTQFPPAALILEPIQSAEGILPAGHHFLKGVIEIAREFECLVIFDEIYTGFGRCGTPFYSSRDGLTPDMLVVGKALGNGLPISAVLGTPSVMNALPAGVHTSTFSGHPLACAVANAVLDLMKDITPWQQSALNGARILEFLKHLETEYSLIFAPRGEGFMLGFDCVDLRGHPSPALAKDFVTAALARGLILRYGGFEGCTIKLTPPLTVDAEELEFLVNTLSQVVDDIAPASV
ncbi:aspartate aminotransferase family protein [Nostoc sp. CHAB 5824]|nr:aspartate aminotransferase family protein [Nostoc sp. CHAB 5824]